MKDSTRWIILATVTVAAACTALFMPRIPQWISYHHFADQRTLHGIPHFMDVMSNLPFFLVSVLGFWELRRQRKGGFFEDTRVMVPYAAFFTAVLLTGLGSSYYHWMPNNARLFWDRLPMTFIAMSLVAIILMEKTNVRTGLRALGPLLLLGAGSVLYWSWTEAHGRGDLTIYGFVLFFPALFIPLVLVLFPKPFPAANELARLVVYYGLAKAFEAKDAAIYEVTGFISGHTLKHLLAAFSVYWVVRMLQKRKETTNPLWRSGRFPKLLLSFVVLVLLGAVLLVRSMVSMPGHSSEFVLKHRYTAEEKALEVRLRAHVDMLARTIGIRDCDHPADAKRLEKTAAYIRSVWKGQSYQVQEQPYDVGVTVENLWVEKKGKTRPDEILVIGAHYDGVEDGPAANDNGSGVAALLELSRTLAGQPLGPTVQFVAFTNEEPPFFQTESMGSLIYARELGREGKKVIGMISLETIGCYLAEKGSQQYPWPFSLFYPDRGNFIAFVGDYGSRDWVRRCVGTFRKECDFPSEGVAAPGSIQGIGWSDHWSFWQEGYPALMVTDTAPFRYKYYHTPEDTLDNIDFPDMARVVEGLEKTVQELVQEDAK